MNGGTYRNTVFLGFFLAIYLHQNFGADVEFFTVFAYFLSEPKRIDRVDHVGISQKLADLVSLKMTNHMPVDFFRQSGVVGILLQESLDVVSSNFQMLYPVFAKFAASETDNLLYGVEIG